MDLAIVEVELAELRGLAEKHGWRTDFVQRQRRVGVEHAFQLICARLTQASHQQLDAGRYDDAKQTRETALMLEDYRRELLDAAVPEAI